MLARAGLGVGGCCGDTRNRCLSTSALKPTLPCLPDLDLTLLHHPHCLICASPLLGTCGLPPFPPPPAESTPVF